MLFFCENINDIIVYMLPKQKVLKHCSLFKKPVRIWEFFSFFDKNMVIFDKSLLSWSAVLSFLVHIVREGRHGPI